MTVSFKPSHIFVDEACYPLPLTQRVLKFFPAIPFQIISNPKKFKRPLEMTAAKKGLLLARHKSDLPLKPFQALQKNSGRPHYSLNLISNCHLECTYCILQSYLANNPFITLYANIEEILEKTQRQLKILTKGAVIGTGKIADSLALEPFTGLSAALISFFANENHSHLLELKTKSDFVEGILNLNHKGKTVVSWSMNPQTIVEREEFKTASIPQRLRAAKRCAEAGYKVGFHLDPMILHENWKKNYKELIDEIFETIPPKQIAWLSLGTLRFPERQKKIIEKRFPKNKELFEGLRHTHLPYLTYEAALRKEMYETATQFIRRHAPAVELYYCMENEI